MTDGRRSEALRELKVKMGRDWVYRWYETLEMVAEKMDETDRHELTLPISEWCLELGCNQSKFRLYLVWIESKLNCKVIENELGICVKIPNLLKIRDNHTSNLQVTSKPLVSKIKSKEIRVKNKSKEYLISEDRDINTTPKPPKGAVSPAPQKLGLIYENEKEVQKIWNEWAIKNRPAICCETINETLKKKILVRIKEEKFDLVKIFEAIEADDFFSGRTEHKFCIKLEYIARNDSNYLNLINKNKALNGNSESNGHEEHINFDDFEPYKNDYGVTAYRRKTVA